MKKILILDANSLQALTIAKYIKLHSDYRVIACVEGNIKFNKKYYDEIIIEDYLKIDVQNYDFVLPMGAISTFKYLNKYPKIEYLNSIIFTKENLICSDKPKMLQIAQQESVPIPETYYYIEDIGKYPIFYKDNFEQGGGTVGVAHRVEDIPLGELIYQEYINTPSTYGVSFLAKDGKILESIMHKELISSPLLGGSAVVIESFDDKRLEQYTKKLLKRLDYNGWGLAEFKYCNKRDDFVFMEINAKFWASIEFVLLNEPKFLQLLLDIKYKKKHTNKILFVNRLLQYDIKQLFLNIGYLKIPVKIVEYSIIYQIARRLTPNILVKYIRRFFK